MLSFISQFKKRVRGLSNYIALLVVDAKHYQKANIELTRYFVEQENIPGIYVTLNKPFEILQRTFEQEGIDTRLILFIDCIAKPSTGTITKIGNCLYITSPERLSDMSVAIEQAVGALPQENKFVFFDSLSTLLIYNNMGTVARFSHFLVSKIRAWKVKGVLILLRKDRDETLVNEITQFCDVRLDIGSNHGA